MRREESRYPKDWFRIGDKELERARNLLKLRDFEGKHNRKGQRISRIES